MVIISIDTSSIKKEDAYDKLRDDICEALKGNKAFIENDIVVSEDHRPDFLDICLGSDGTEPLDIVVFNYCTFKPRKPKGESS